MAANHDPKAMQMVSAALLHRFIAAAGGRSAVKIADIPDVIRLDLHIEDGVAIISALPAVVDPADQQMPAPRPVAPQNLRAPRILPASATALDYLPPAPKARAG